MTAEWAPAPGLVVLAWLVTVAAAGWTATAWLTSADPAGGLIAAVATVGAGLAALFGTRARPRLRADADGVTVGGLLRQRHHPWPLVATCGCCACAGWGGRPRCWSSTPSPRTAASASTSSAGWTSRPTPRTSHRLLASVRP